MKKIIGLLLMFCMSELYANQYMHFIGIPPSVTNSEVIIVLKDVALKRRWNITEQSEETLQIKLNHRDYRAVLNFIISDRRVLYSDSTTYLTETINTDADEEGEWLTLIEEEISFDDGPARKDRFEQSL